MMEDVVSIIMLSRNKGRYVAESVRSVIAQTYQNWELIFMDDSSKDDTISQMMELMDEAKVKYPSTTSTGSATGPRTMSRIRVSQNVGAKGSALAMNSALRDARGRWIAFLNVGDLWEPTKLERQIAFMEENGYACSYTCYGVMDAASNDRGVVVSGKARDSIAIPRPRPVHHHARLQRIPRFIPVYGYRRHLYQRVPLLHQHAVLGHRLRRSVNP